MTDPIVLLASLIEIEEHAEAAADERYDLDAMLAHSQRIQELDGIFAGTHATTLEGVALKVEYATRILAIGEDEGALESWACGELRLISASFRDGYRAPATVKRLCSVLSSTNVHLSETYSHVSEILHTVLTTVQRPVLALD